MHVFSQIIRKTELVMRCVAAFCLVAMALLTGSDVIARSFSHPIFGSEEIVRFLAVLVIAFSLPYAHSQGSHIGVELVFRHFPKKVRHALTFCTNLTAFGLFCVVTWRMYLYALSMRASGEVSLNLELPEYLVVFATALGFLWFTLFLLRDVFIFFKKETQ